MASKKDAPEETPAPAQAPAPAAASSGSVKKVVALRAVDGMNRGDVKEIPAKRAALLLEKHFVAEVEDAPA